MRSIISGRMLVKTKDDWCINESDDDDDEDEKDVDNAEENGDGDVDVVVGGDAEDNRIGTNELDLLVEDVVEAKVEEPLLLPFSADFDGCFTFEMDFVFERSRTMAESSYSKGGMDEVVEEVIQFW